MYIVLLTRFQISILYQTVTRSGHFEMVRVLFNVYFLWTLKSVIFHVYFFIFWLDFFLSFLFFFSFSFHVTYFLVTYKLDFLFFQLFGLVNLRILSNLIFCCLWPKKERVGKMNKNQIKSILFTYKSKHFVYLALHHTIEFIYFHSKVLWIFTHKIDKIQNRSMS